MHSDSLQYQCCHRHQTTQKSKIEIALGSCLRQKAEQRELTQSHFAIELDKRTFITTDLLPIYCYYTPIDTVKLVTRINITPRYSRNYTIQITIISLPYLPVYSRQTPF